MRIGVLLLGLACCQVQKLAAQNGAQYSIAVESSNTAVLTPKLKMGTGVRLNGESFGYTGNYLRRNGKPWFPVMGEFHYSRCNEQEWEQQILAMKAGGIEVISTYVIWIHHEIKEGEFDWKGNRNLKRFLELCHQHGMYVWLRPGPWVHAEVKNGGFPDWLMHRTLKLRTNDAEYLHYSNILFKQIASQCEGYYFKQGGPLIGIQVENELPFKNDAAYAHMKTLKQMLIQAGMDVPYYSAFSQEPDDQDEFLYMIGGYPDSPWNSSTKDLFKPVYFVRPLKADADIGSDLFGQVDTKVRNNYPLLSAELGGGMQVTYHRRVQVSAADVFANAFVKVASGLNSLGYYMYHGGINPVDRPTNGGLHETRVSGYPNDLPLINYDFQSPLGAMGIPAASFNELKLLHLFLHDYGEALAEARPYFPAKKKESMFSKDTVQASVRLKNGAGFIFLSNYQRLVPLQAVENFQLALNNGAAQELVPAKPIVFPANYYAIWPYRLNMKNVVLKYATVQPLCILNKKAVPTFVFFRDSINAEMRIEESTVKEISVLKDCRWDEKSGTISADKSAGSFYFEATNKDGERIKVLVLTREQALQANKVHYAGKGEALVITGALVRQQENQLSFEATGTDGKVAVQIYPGGDVSLKTSPGTVSCKQVESGSLFSSYIINAPAGNKPSVKYVPTFVKDTQSAQFFKDSLLHVYRQAKAFNPLQPGALYQLNFQSLPGQQLYGLNFNFNPTAGIADWQVTVQYDGDVLAIYQDKKLVYDQFNYNGFCTFRVNALGVNRSSSLLAQVLPAEKQYDIYWGSLHKAGNDPLTARIKRVEVQPVYRFYLAIDKKVVK